MTSRRRWMQHSVSVAVALVTILGIAAVAFGAAAPTTTPTATSAAPAPAAGTPAVDKPTSNDREMAKELRALAEAWQEGGGRYGYPFWEKSYRLWSAKAMTASVFREYVTGYRDNLQLGCELLDTVDVNHDASRDVRDLIVDACDRRLEALRAQKRELDAIVKRSTTPAIALDSEERADLAGEIAEQHSIVNDKLQQSWRDTRLAMDRAQTELDRFGFERLDEDVFL